MFAMEELRRLLVQRQSDLLDEVEKVRDLISMLDAFPASSPTALGAWRWRDFRSLVDKLSTHDVDTFGTKLEFEVTGDPLRGGVVSRGEGGLAARRKVSGNTKPAIIISMTQQILLYHNRPMARAELLDELLDRGLNISGYDPVKVLGTTLWRAGERLINLKGFGYWLVDKAYPPANYFPPGRLADGYE